MPEERGLSQAPSSVLHPDILRFIETSMDTLTLTHFDRLITFQAKTNLEDLSTEIERVFEAGSNDERPELNHDNIMATNLGTITAALIEFNMIDAPSDVSIGHILEMMKKICYNCAYHLMVALYGDTSKHTLPRKLSHVFETQMDRVFEALDKTIPFVDTDAASADEIRSMMMEISSRRQHAAPQVRTYMPVVRTLNAHTQKCKRLVQFDDTYKDSHEEMFDSSVVRSAIFYILRPWIVFKFLATFVSGPWNKGHWRDEVRPSFIDMRNAELGLYRMAMDVVNKVRNAIISYPASMTDTTLQAMLQSTLDEGDEQLDAVTGTITMSLEPSEHARTLYFNGYRTHIFDRVGEHTLRVRMGGRIDALVVAGGGGGGNAVDGNPAGGGGGGEVVTMSAPVDTEQTVTIRVGAGGEAGEEGEQSSLDNQSGLVIVARGGGNGGDGNRSGGHGGSGGGAGVGGGERGGSLIDADDIGKRFGNVGAMANSGEAGGGGGAKAPAEGKKGGMGHENDFTRVQGVYGSGGGGGTSAGSESKGGEGGTNGGRAGKPGRGGVNGTGSGGGGGSGPDGAGGRGGNGIVVVRYNDGTGGGMVMENLEQLGHNILQTVNTRFVANEQMRIPRFYHSISLLSNASKHVSMHLHHVNTELEQRKQNLKNILENKQFIIKSTRREAIMFYVAATATALLLLMFGTMLSTSVPNRTILAASALVILIGLALLAVQARRQGSMVNRLF